MQFYDHFLNEERRPLVAADVFAASDGLSFQFQSYEVGPYYIGLPVATIRWNEIEDLLVSDAYVFTSTY